MLQDKIDKIQKYFKSMELTNGTFIVSVKYEPKWGVFPSEDGKIKVTPSEEIDDEWFYYAKSAEKTIDDVFDLINETIDSNLAAAEKYKLLIDKFDELKKMFAEEDLDRLKTLKFVLGKVKKVKKTKKSNETTEVKTDETNDGNNDCENDVIEDAQ